VWVALLLQLLRETELQSVLLCACILAVLVVVVTRDLPDLCVQIGRKLCNLVQEMP
jgi:hypothetical protein